MGINFGGLDWDIRTDGDYKPYGPGPNYFQGQGAGLKDGKLHLSVAQDAKGNWECPELVSQKRLGFGEYSTVIESVWLNGTQVPITSLDPHVVFGFFGYPTSDLGPDGTHEFDIELSYWGVPGASNFIQLSNWATKLTPGKSSQMWRGEDFNENFDLSKMNPIGISITRGPDYMEWKVWDTATGAHLNHREEGLSATQLSQATEPFHLNLWLKDSKAPSGNVELVLSKFDFAPLR